MSSVKYRKCTRKVKYTKAEAKAQIRVRESAKGTPLYYYRCSFCAKYHISHKPSNYIHPSSWNKIKKGTNQ